MAHQDVIETPRLCLRVGQAGDEAGIVAGLNDWAVAQWLLRPPFPYAEADARTLIARTGEAGPDGFHSRRLITDRVTGAILGSVTMNGDGVRAELAYWLMPAAQGQGIATEAARALLEAAARAWPTVETVFATIDPENLASHAVLRRLGLQQTGLLHRETPTRRGATVALVFEAPLAAFGGGGVLRMHRNGR